MLTSVIYRDPTHKERVEQYMNSQKKKYKWPIVNFENTCNSIKER